MSMTVHFQCNNFSCFGKNGYQFTPVRVNGHIGSGRSTPRPATAATSSSCCCPETDPTGAWVLAEKVRIGVTDLEIQVAGARIPVSISVGVVNFPDDGQTSDALMISADQAMYASKRAGKNRVMGFPVTIGGGADEAV